MNSTSESEFDSNTWPPGVGNANPPLPRVVALDAEPRRYLLTAWLAVTEGLRVEDVTLLYWTVRAMDAVTAEVDDEELVAKFVRHSASAEVAAWGLIDELRSLPHATLTRLEARNPETQEVELVLTADCAVASLYGSAA